MQIAGMYSYHAELVRSLKQMIEAMEGDDKIVAQCVFVLLASHDVGADIDELAKYTGCPRKYIKAISQRMRNADLWGDDGVDYLAWWYQEDKLQAEFQARVLVAKGDAVRGWPRYGHYRYIDIATGEVIGEWTVPDG